MVPAGAEGCAINLRLLQVRPEKPAILPPTLVADPIGACDKGREKEGECTDRPDALGDFFVPTVSRMGTGSPRGNANLRLAEPPVRDTASSSSCGSIAGCCGYRKSPLFGDWEGIKKLISDRTASDHLLFFMFSSGRRPHQ